MADETCEFPIGLDWLNVNRAPELESLRGKVVLVVFWCYSNSQSMQLLASLRLIQQEHDRGLAVIGIHCPKFDHEHDSGNVRQAVHRNFLRFPVASDPSFAAWRYFRIHGWPSVAVIDAAGRLREVVRGDDGTARIDALTEALLQEAAAQDRLDTSRPPPTRPGGESGFLRFPSGVLEARGMLYVSDTANNRIIELTLAGRVQRIFGSGSPGLWDGSGATCGFTLPRGLACAENFLYVADTGNHAIRRIDLFKGEVEVVVGNGRGQPRMTGSTRRLMEVGIPLPVGLAFQGPDLFVSAAGMGQLWRLDLAQGTVGWFTGTGQYGVVDGEPVQAAFAQPLGLAACRNFVYVADADGSAVRELRIQSGYVRTRIGQHPFAFGHQDGPAADAQLQYPMAVALHERSDQLWIADSFNDCLRVLDLKRGEVHSPDLAHPFREPAALSITGNNLWVANTNAHEIVRVDLSNRHCEVLEIEAGQ